MCIRDRYKKIRLEIDKYIEKNHYEVVYTISAGLLESKDVADSSFQNLMTVSYTHLDVYKRQMQPFVSYNYGKGNAERLKQGIQYVTVIAFIFFRICISKRTIPPLQSTFANPTLVSLWLSPVSYTHLDVYKRQT